MVSPVRAPGLWAWEPSAEDDDEEGVFKGFHHNKTARA